MPPIILLISCVIDKCIMVSAPQLKLTHDRMTVTGDKGYSMIRGTHGRNFMAYFICNKTLVTYVYSDLI